MLKLANLGSKWVEVEAELGNIYLYRTNIRANKQDNYEEKNNPCFQQMISDLLTVVHSK